MEPKTLGFLHSFRRYGGLSDFETSCFETKDGVESNDVLRGVEG